MLRKGGAQRSGFTLPEVLVTVAIVSVLAAIVVPTVTSQIGKGDDTRFQSTITNVRTGITAFVSDTRRFPRRLSHLFNPITGQNDLFGTAYGAAVETRWKGPYTTGALALDATLPLSLGFLQDSLIDSNLTTGLTSGQVIGTVDVAGFTTAASIARLDTLLDAGNGDDAGVLQWAPALCNPCTRIKLQLMGSR